MLDWDSTNIVFTKRTLIEFLKYTGTTVDPNFTNIAKLPRYAKFGKITEDPSPLSATGDANQVSGVPSSTSGAVDDFKPTRRVRTVPGGPHSDIFGGEVEDDALASAPPRQLVHEDSPATSITAETLDEDGLDFGNGFKPSRRVRTTPGGPSSMANLWDAAEPEEFKPTRRLLHTGLDKALVVKTISTV
ncbi:hypothetical protein H0H87_010254 [Tephrocybe sp. NHM501043]|nr:hypothetical protein H0H87_010254 [Tephrocybe sp. NHM501043]